MVTDVEQFSKKIRVILHGVKNHLQVLNSLFELQLMDATDYSATAAFRESLGRLRVLTVIYKNLSSEDSYASVDFGKAVAEILDQMLSSFSKFDHAIISHVIIPDLILDVDTALPLGLIMNELFMNSLSNMQPEDGRQISVQLLPFENEDAIIEYSDTGMHLPANLNWNNSKQSLGMRMVTGLSRQIGGRAEMIGDPVKSFRIYLKKSSIIKR